MFTRISCPNKRERKKWKRINQKKSQPLDNIPTTAALQKYIVGHWNLIIFKAVGWQHCYIGGELTHYAFMYRAPSKWQWSNEMMYTAPLWLIHSVCLKWWLSCKYSAIIPSSFPHSKSRCYSCPKHRKVLCNHLLLGYFEAEVYIKKIRGISEFRTTLAEEPHQTTWWKQWCETYVTYWNSVG